VITMGKVLLARKTYPKVMQVISIGSSFVIVSLILGYLVYRQREVLFGFKWQFRIQYLFLSFFLFSCSLVLVSFIWGQIINALAGTQHFIYHMRFFCISNFIKRLPGTIWYLLSRTSLYKEIGISAQATLIASGIEFIVALISSALVGLFLLIRVFPGYMGMLYILLLLVIGGGLIHPKVLSMILKLFRVSTPGSVGYRQLVIWVIGYGIVWVINGLILYSIANIVTYVPAIHISKTIQSVTLANVVTSLLLFAPTNLGATEVSISAILSTFLPSSVAVVITIFSRVLLTIFDLIWGGIALLILPSKVN